MGLIMKHEKVHSLAVSPDGKYIISGAGVDGSVKVWNSKTGELIQTLKGHKDTIWTINITPDGKYIYTIDGSLNFNDVKISENNDTVL